MKRAGIAAGTLVALLGLAYVHPFGNPRDERARGTLLETADLPKDARAVLVTKCADCHSSETRWPAYARIAPASWLVEFDVARARERMNLSRWAEMPVERQEVMKAKIVQEARSGAMPPARFVALHWGARLTEAEVQSLSLLAVSSRGKEGGDGEVDGGAVGDVARGRLAFEKRCTGCHTLEVNREGPRLGGVYGRRAGSVAGFRYSSELKRSGLVWTDETLERWLRDPDLLVPNNNMEFHVAKAEERRDLIAYLKR